MQSSCIQEKRLHQIPHLVGRDPTWTQTAVQQGWAVVASSADGTNLVVAVYGGPIYTSSIGNTGSVGGDAGSGG
jgi:hypothetical protein